LEQSGSVQSAFRVHSSAVSEYKSTLCT